MIIVANRPLHGDYGRVATDQHFEADDTVARLLLSRGLVRLPAPPAIVYETKVVVPEAPEVSPRRPFVTCLCLTRNRRQWLPEAIQHFLKQDYQSKELLILADGADVADLVPNHPQIRLMHLSRPIDIGTKRNIGCEQALGQFIAHWDDDDYYGPGRLSDQLERLISSGAAVSGYRTARFTTGNACWMYLGNLDFAIGASLVYRRDWWTSHRFKPMQVGEDNAFVAEASMARRLVVSDAEERFVASIHSANTSPRRVEGTNWRQICAEGKCIHRLAA